MTTDRVAHCSGGHSFDWAKELYLNLLPVHAKQSKDPGDSPDMVQARRRFLNTGHYNPIIDTIIAQIDTEVGTRKHILDAGCGEGYYLGRIKNALPETNLYGLDISKHAVRAAAKAYKNITWLVASNRQLPFPTQSLDAIICAFGFPVWYEFIRVLKPGGIMIMIDSGPDHLIELRQMLYDDVKVKETVFDVPDNMTLQAEERVLYPIGLTEPDIIRDLIAMTPHQHRATSDTISKAAATGFPSLTVDAMIRILSV